MAFMSYESLFFSGAANTINQCAAWVKKDRCSLFAYAMHNVVAVVAIRWNSLSSLTITCQLILFYL